MQGGARAVDAVAFDLDDTLWRESDAQVFVMERFHRLWAVKAPLDAFLEVWRRASESLFDEYAAGRLSHSEQRRLRVRALLEAFSLPDEESAVDLWVERYVELYRSRWRPVPGAAQVLERLHEMGVHLALVTNGDGAMQRAKLARMGLGDRFDGLLISAEVGAAKPDPRIFRRLIELCATTPERILVVGDRPDKDIEPARAMGLKALQIDHSGRASGADVVHDLDAVVDWVARSRQGQGVGARPTDVAGHGAGA